MDPCDFFAFFQSREEVNTISNHLIIRDKKGLAYAKNNSYIRYVHKFQDVYKMALLFASNSIIPYVFLKF